MLNPKLIFRKLSRLIGRQKKFKIKVVTVYALGLGKDRDYIIKEFKSREEAEEWCRRQTNSANNLWWGDGIYYYVEGK